jgi:hypothetical protein
MYALIVLCAGIGTAYLACRVRRGASFGLADLLIGAVGGLIGLSVAHYFGMAALGLPLLLACGLTLGLSSNRTAHA